MFPVFSAASQKVESRCTWTPFQSYFYVPVSISKVKVGRGSMSHFSKFPTTLYFHLKASKPRSCFSKDASYQSGGSTEMLLFSLLGCRERTFRLEGKNLKYLLLTGSCCKKPSSLNVLLFTTVTEKLLPH